MYMYIHVRTYVLVEQYCMTVLLEYHCCAVNNPLTSSQACNPSGVSSGDDLNIDRVT